MEVRPTGRARYKLMSALDRNRLSEPARREIGELERRHAKVSDGAPVSVVASFVGSPISDESSVNMSDDDWLRALRKHNHHRTDWNGDKPVGGARELAQVLGRRAESEPARFAALSLKFSPDIDSSASDNVIRAVASVIDSELLADVCEHAKEIHGPAVGGTICSVAQEMRPTIPRMVELVASYADDPDPDREWAQTEASNGTAYYGGDLDSAGLNSTRGQAAYAVASILFESGNHLERLAPLVETLATDAVLGVRVYAAEAVVAMLNYDADRAYTAAERLFDADIAIFDSQLTERLLTYMVIRNPSKFAPTLVRALGGPDSVAKRAGEAWVHVSSSGDLVADLPQTVDGLNRGARRGAAETFARNVALFSDRIPVLFDDEDEEVRRLAAWSLRRIDGVRTEQVDALVRDFIPSRAFAEHFDDLIEALETVAAIDSETAVVACERAIELAGNEIGDIRTARAGMGQSIMRVVLRAYRQGAPELRSRCLDVVDRLSELNAHGVTEALRDER